MGKSITDLSSVTTVGLYLWFLGSSVPASSLTILLENEPAKDNRKSVNLKPPTASHARIPKHCPIDRPQSPRIRCLNRMHTHIATGAGQSKRTRISAEIEASPLGYGHVAELTKSAHESFAGPPEVARCAKPDLRSQVYLSCHSEARWLHRTADCSGTPEPSSSRASTKIFSIEDAKDRWSSAAPLAWALSH